MLMPRLIKRLKNNIYNKITVFNEINKFLQSNKAFKGHWKRAKFIKNYIEIYNKKIKKIDYKKIKEKDKI